MRLFGRFARLEWKLPLAIVGLGGLVAAGVGVGAYVTASSSLEQQARVSLSATLDSRKEELRHYLESIGEDLQLVAASTTARSALEEFSEGWRQIGDHPTEMLQRLYITDNPHPTGQKDKLDAAQDGSVYSEVHARYHPWFHELQQQRGYYDVFLFDQAGNLVYTVFKELDYATNLVSGEWRDTDLGAAFRAARDNPARGFQAFFDFRSYAPSHGAPASFISTPVMGEHGELLGVLAFQMPVDRLNEVLQATIGLGETGQAFVVGRDGLMRTDSRFSRESTILQRKIGHEAVAQALAGKAGTADVLTASGVEAIAAYAPIAFNGVEWAMIAEMDRAEILAAADTLLVRILGITAAALLCLTAVGWYLSRGITAPLLTTVATVARLSRGENVEVVGKSRADEIGDLARSLDQVYQRGLEAARLRSALDCSQSHVMVANRRREIIYLNPSLQRLLKSHETEIRKALPHFKADEINGALIDVFHKNPEHQKKLLETLRTTHVADIRLAGLRLTLAMSPILNAAGENIGTVAEWRDRTAELNALEEIDRVTTAASRGDFGERMAVENKEGAFLAIARSINTLTGVVDDVTTDLGGMLEALAQGDLRRKITRDYQGRFGELKQNANDTVEQLVGIVGEIQMTAGEVRNAASEITSGTEDLSAPSRRGQSRGDRGFDRGDGRDRQAECRERQECERARRQRRPERQDRRRRGQAGGRRHGRHRRLGAEDHRHHLGDRRDRLPDQPSGAQRQRRGGPRRRGGQGLRRGRPGGAPARATLGTGGIRHQGPDPEQQRSGQGRRRTGQPGGRIPCRDRRLDRQGRGNRHGDLERVAGAGCRRAGDQPLDHQHGRDDPAKLGPGRTKQRSSKSAQPPG
ncbi:MAG: HAMP domain-containing protein [Rhizobiales bacterium]|nr:HAMP domain-containing protein [Hyphomicrobiales bacterium]